jgi:hypothetical protein
LCYNISNLKSYGGGKLIKTNELKAEITRNGYTQEDMAKIIGIAPKTFYLKMKKGVFGSDEIQIMIDKLKIKDPVSIFFAD